MKNRVRGLALIVTMLVPSNANAVLFDTGTRFLVYDRQNQRWSAPVSGQCEYEGLTLHLSCDLEKPDPACEIVEISNLFPEDFCPPKVVIQYPSILYCFKPKDCDKEYMCC